MDNEAKEERRHFPRYSFKEENLINGMSNAYGLNICEDGMFVCTLISPEKGSVLNLTIASQLTVKAEVKIISRKLEWVFSLLICPMIKRQGSHIS